MLREIRERLRATLMPPFRILGGAGDFARLKNRPEQYPAAYVLPLDESAGESLLLNAVHQEVAVRVGVLIATEQLADAGGAAAADHLQDLKAAVHGALVGWTPEGASEPLLYAGGEIQEAPPGAVWWLAGYATATALRVT